MAKNFVFCVRRAPEEAFEQGHMTDQKNPTNKLKINITEISLQCFICFLNLKTFCALPDKL